MVGCLSSYGLRWPLDYMFWTQPHLVLTFANLGIPSCLFLLKLARIRIPISRHVKKKLVFSFDETKRQSCPKMLVPLGLCFRCELVAKAIRRLDCSTTEGAGAIGRGGGDDQPSSSPVYWNELSSMTGVFRQRLIQKLVEVRQLLDGLTGGLHRLEVSYEINAD